MKYPTIDSLEAWIEAAKRLLAPACVREFLPSLDDSARYILQRLVFSDEARHHALFAISDVVREFGGDRTRVGKILAESTDRCVLHLNGVTQRLQDRFLDQGVTADLWWVREQVVHRFYWTSEEIVTLRRGVRRICCPSPSEDDLPASPLEAGGYCECVIATQILLRNLWGVVSDRDWLRLDEMHSLLLYGSRVTFESMSTDSEVLKQLIESTVRALSTR